MTRVGGYALQPRRFECRAHKVIVKPALVDSLLNAIKGKGTDTVLGVGNGVAVVKPQDKYMNTPLLTREIIGLPMSTVRAEIFHHQSANAQRLIISIDLSQTYFDCDRDEWITSHCYFSPHQVSLAIAALRRVEQRLSAMGHA